MWSLKPLSPVRRLSPNLRILAAAVGVAFLVGALTLLDPLEGAMQVSRNKLRSHDASGAIVLVAIDDASIAELGPAPWSRTRMAQMVARLNEAGARSTHLEEDLSRATTPEADRALAAAMARARNVTAPARISIDPLTGARRDIVPGAQFATPAQWVSSNILVRRGYAVLRHLYAVDISGRAVPWLASRLAGVDGPRGQLFPIVYAISLRSIPVISAADILSGRLDPRAVNGRAVVIGDTSAEAKRYFAPGIAEVPGIFFQIVAAETLLSGRPTSVSWPVSTMFAAAIALAFLSFRNRLIGRLMLVGGFALFTVGPIMLEQQHIFTQVAPGLALLVVAATLRAIWRVRQAFQARGLTHPVSGLPNLNALRQAGASPGTTLVAARIQNFAEVRTALPPDCERELVEQIVSRMGFGTAGATVYQGDEGMFCWLSQEERVETLVSQLDGLHALFRSPIIVASRLVDLTVTFGLDTDGSRPVTQRLASGLVAADAAAAEGRRWLAHDPATREDAEWKMSLLGQLDRAIRNHEIWVAYQPKFDLMTGALVGAEALARWKHPEKGEIFPSQFIPAAEKSGRIEGLTVHVLDSAIAAAAAINRGGREFSIAVNLSPRLLNEPGLVAMVGGLLERHRLAPRRLILEITETTAMTGEDASFANLERLSALGVQLSIDDYGTGFSTLDYLKRIPAAEIKIDRSFVGMIEKSQSDRIMVHSTIQLAHSLGRRAVAEGVENEATLQELRRMNCDYVQGYHTGRPMPLDALLTRLVAKEESVLAYKQG